MKLALELVGWVSWMELFRWNSWDGILPTEYSGASVPDAEQVHLPTTPYRFVSFLRGTAGSAMTLAFRS
jgi:hypothetical protein